MSPIKQQFLAAIAQAPDPVIEELFAILQNISPSPQAPKPRASFGALKNSGEILDDIIAPAVALNEWEVLQ
jgi:hypothetical protein